MSTATLPDTLLVETEDQAIEIPATMTEDEFVDWAMQNSVRAEWVDGKVVVMASASRRHVLITGWLQQVLGILVVERRLGALLGPEYMIRLTKGRRARRVPDLLFVASARLHLLKKNHLEGAPDMAIEVVSPDSVARDWREKYLAYETEGVREYWVIDPLAEHMEVYSLGEDGHFRTMNPRADGVLASDVVTGFYLRPEWLWLDPLPSALAVLREFGVVT